MPGVSQTPAERSRLPPPLPQSPRSGAGSARCRRAPASASPARCDLHTPAPPGDRGWGTGGRTLPTHLRLPVPPDAPRAPLQADPQPAGRELSVVMEALIPHPAPVPVPRSRSQPRPYPALQPPAAARGRHRAPLCPGRCGNSGCRREERGKEGEE